MTTRKGYAWQRLRRTRLALAAERQEPCHLCGLPIRYDLDGRHRLGPTVDHLDPIALGGPVLAPLDRLAPAHRSCNSRDGQAISVERKKQQKRRNAFLPSAPAETPAVSNPRKPSRSVSEYPDPRWMSPGHPQRAGSYGEAALEWIRARRQSDDLVPDDEKDPLPVWELILDRALEHDRAGRLCWPVVVLTVPRQSTKSSLMSEVMAWRMHSAELFGERQLCLHTANRLKAALRVQQDLYPWAKTLGYRVNQSTGAERIINPTTQDTWEITSFSAAYGARPSFVFIDEAFDVARSHVEKALIPAQARRKSPQLWLVSTANTACTDLMLTYMSRAKAGSERILLMDWGLDPAFDPQDRAAWALANPYPTESYLDLVEANVGSDDWQAQWLNVWPRLAAETGWLDPAAWEASKWPGAWPEGPIAVAVEESPQHQWAVARAVKSGERIVVEAIPVESPADVRTVVDGWATPGMTVVAGKSAVWACDPAWAAQPVTHTQHYAEASGVFVAGMKAGLWAHVPGPELDAQLPAMQHKGIGGAGILRGSTDYVARCAIWAGWLAHQRQASFMVV